MYSTPVDVGTREGGGDSGCVYAASQLVATGVHRLYVVGDSDDSTATKTKAGDSLKGVISLSDIIDVFVSEPEGYFDESGSVALHVHDTIRKRHGSVCVRK